MRPETPIWVKVLIVLAVFLPSTLLVNCAVANSKVLSDFMEALADRRLTWWDRIQVLLGIWRKPDQDLEDLAERSQQALNRAANELRPGSAKIRRQG